MCNTHMQEVKTYTHCVYVFISCIFSVNVISIFTVPTKVLVLTGYDSNGYDDSRSNSEVLDLIKKPYRECQNMAIPPEKAKGATGGLVEGRLLICGGKDSELFHDECYRVTKISTSLIKIMKEKRAYATSVVVNHIKLWILGGRSCNNDNCLLNSTEYFHVGQYNYYGPNLPNSTYGHTITAWNSTSYIIIGGHGGLKKTFLHSENNHEIWITGPELNQGRSQHAAGLGIDTATSETYIAVTGGMGYLDSVEILYSGDTEWNTGK